MTEHKHPRDMTQAEFDALPIGPDVRVFTPHTAAELQAGAVGRGTVRLYRKATVAMHFAPDDPIAFQDNSGHTWTIGRWADGGYFKQPAFF